MNDTVGRFCHFLLWRGEFYVYVVGKFEPKKITTNWQKRLFLTLESLNFLLYFVDGVLICNLQTN